MKTFQIASIVALASVAAAQLDNIPSCALNCFVGPLTSDGCSSLTDFACHCKQGATLLGKVQPCVQGACSADDQAAAISAVESTCSAAGAPIVIPSAGASAVASATGAASSAASSASAAASSAQSEASSAVESASSAVASAASSLAGAVSSALASATASANSSASASASATSQFTGGAPQATGAAVLIGAAAFAMLL
ncbi:CFEM-domain-containing protein [Plenodomus tracheiphilus IPT5]|uniref:CFEM-domain-containing protein n=1 Tax=Plenodomus tracheiphilus IPT5 TaxID=1408161 RepID=A0A6A7BNQ7_9PLEO|nr:CFEM-domain-containing protein [Plenodomus tracheiphilus IPT5]